MSVAELEQRTLEKVKAVANCANAQQALTRFLTVRPLGSKDREVLRQDLECLQAILSRLPDKDIEPAVQSLTEDQAEVLVDYLGRFMQFVGENDNPVASSGSMLRLYERIVKQYGPSILAKAAFRTDSLVQKIPNY